jgi:hypothetical protein
VATEGDVLLVGSLPFDGAEEAFQGAAAAIGDHVHGLPDGEFGHRQLWVGYLPAVVYSANPALVVPDGFREPHQPKRGAARPRPTHLPTPPLWRIKAGERLDLAGAGYGEIAVRSWEVFERQREKGIIRPGTRFQVSFPGTVSAIDYFFAEEDRPAARDAYHAAVHRAVEMILSVAPAVDLAFQFDLCYELIDLAQGDAHYVPHFPARSYEEKVNHYASALDELGRGIPDEARLGYHWCYGTWGGWPMTELTDLTHCVRMSNEAVRRTPRRVDYVHMPVVKHPREEFFAPLADLDIGETAVYLGLIHHTDGVAGFRERMELARRYLPAFGVASVCGFGRVPREELPAILQAHRDCAVELQRAKAAPGASAP